MQASTWRARLPIYIVLTAGSLLFLFPLLWMVSTSLKPIQETMVIPPRWLPSEWQWENYGKALTYGGEKPPTKEEKEKARAEGRQPPPRPPLLDQVPFLRYALNTLYLALLGVAGTVLANAVVAYGFARVHWRGRDALFAVTLATMMVPFPVTMVAVFTLFRHLGWIGTFRPLWVPAWLGSAFNIFLLRQFFMTIPRELSDAARIDGCNELRILWNVVLPLAKPALAVVALFHFMYVWNDFLGPLIYLTDQKMFTLALGLQFFQSRHGGSDWNTLMAASTMVVLPVILLFFFTQRTFIQGLQLTGLKG